VPQGHSSKVKSLVSIQDLKLIGSKSHDCNVLMQQQLLPITIRGILPKNVRHTIVRIIGLKQQGSELFLKDFRKY